MKRWSTSLELFAIAVVARCALLWATLVYRGAELTHYFDSSDAPSYVAISKMLLTGQRPHNDWHERVFFGWPMLISLPGALIGHEAVCLWLGVLLAALVPVGYHWITGDVWAARLLAVFTPTWLIHSSWGMSEPAFLVLQLFGIGAWVHGRSRSAAAAVAMSMIVRPNGVFVLLALAAHAVRERRTRDLVWLIAFAAGAVALVLICNSIYYGDPLRQLHSYADLRNVAPATREALLSLPGPAGHLGLPFVHLIGTPLLAPTPLWKIAFIWGHAAAVIAACVVGLRSRQANGLHGIMLTWGLLNAAFIFSTGPYWGFHSFDRYAVWALPAYVALLRSHVPLGPWSVGSAGLVSVALALWTQLRHF